MNNEEAIRVLNCTSLQTFCLCKVVIDGKMLSMKEALGIAVEALENQKTGHWISKPNIYGVVYCSECDYELHTNNTNYCANCGAKMEGEKNDATN